MNKLFKYLTLAAAAVGFSTMAYAIPELYITDNLGHSIWLTDNGGGDTNSTLGMIGWSGTIGTSTVNVAFGVTYPALGTLASPALDSTFNVTGSGTLYFFFAADGFGPTTANVTASTGGTTSGNVTYQVYGGDSNVLFGGSPLTSLGSFGPGAFSGTLSGGSINSAGPYSLLQQITITNVAGGVTSVDSLLSVPDAGMTLLLLGAGLTGLALLGRRQKRRVS